MYLIAEILTLSCVAGVVLSGIVEPRVPSGDRDPEHWHKMARDDITERLNLKENNRIAKNVILFIGDGLGATTVTAARILRGQNQGNPGEETVLKFEEFPNIALSKTYNVDRQTPDSAGTATAILSGSKANYMTVGLDGTAVLDDCPGSADKHVTTMLDWAMAAGSSTGIVTTSRITHATPAAVYAHSANRYWEGEPEAEGGCVDIAKQLIDDNRDINVIMGGGRRYFLPNTTPDPEYGTIDLDNQRRDGRDLTKDWEDDKKDRSRGYKYVWNKEQFDKVNPAITDHLLGLFEPNHMQYDMDRGEDGAGEPSLAEMTRKAIQILKKNRLGFFLMVEGARIDHGHHDNLAVKALYDTLAMEDAVIEALDMTDQDDTLIIVTADHSHPFDITGYQHRGSDIFGLVQPIDPTEDTTDNKPYSVLIYGNGPGHESPRANLTAEDLHNKTYAYPAAVPMPWDTHGGEDVSIYAIGPMGHLFHSVHEQSYIAHVMAYSACIGPYWGKCPRAESECTSGANRMFSFAPIVVVVNIVVARFFV